MMQRFLPSFATLRLLAILALLLFGGFVLAGCDAIGDTATLGEDFGLPPLGPDGVFDDVTEDAASRSPQAIDKLKQADTTMEDAIASLDSTTAENAIKLRPKDPYLRYEKAALLMASSCVYCAETGQALEKASGALIAAHPGASQEDLQAAHNQMLREAIVAVTTGAPLDGQQSRDLHEQWCDTYLVEGKLPVDVPAEPTNPPQPCFP